LIHQGHNLIVLASIVDPNLDTADTPVFIFQAETMSGQGETSPSRRRCSVEDPDIVHKRPHPLRPNPDQPGRCLDSRECSRDTRIAGRAYTPLARLSFIVSFANHLPFLF
jgi:hypothetical protein